MKNLKTKNLLGVLDMFQIFQKLVVRTQLVEVSSLLSPRVLGSNSSHHVQDSLSPYKYSVSPAPVTFKNSVHSLLLLYLCLFPFPLISPPPRSLRQQVFLDLWLHNSNRWLHVHMGMSLVSVLSDYYKSIFIRFGGHSDDPEWFPLLIFCLVILAKTIFLNKMNVIG